MYSKHKDELAKLYNIQMKTQLTCPGCNIEPPHMRQACSKCLLENTIKKEIYPPLDCSVQDLMNCFFETENPIIIEKEGDNYLISLMEGIKTLYLAEDNNLEDALILSLCRISSSKKYHDKIKEKVQKLFME